MNWDNFGEVWDSFLNFMDRVVQWLKYILAPKTDDNTWPPVDYPDIDA